MKINNIVLFGDSILKGVIYDENTNRYKSIGEDKCKKLADELKINIDNLSRFGLTAKKAYDKKLHLNIPSHCDLVLIGLGGNDCDYKWKEISDNPELLHHNNTVPSEFRAIMKNLVKELLDKDINVGLISLPPISSKRYYNWFSRNLNKDKLRIWLKDINVIYKTQEYYNILIRETAKELNVPLLDIRSKFLLNKDFINMLGIDGIHFNSSGYDYMIDNLSNYLVNNY